MATKEELQKRIKALKGAGLSTEAEEAELAKLTKPAPPAKATAKKASAAGQEVNFDIEVDRKSFLSGGQQFGAPEQAGIYQGEFQDIVVPTNKPDQRWFIFKTNDARLEMQIRSALVVTPAGLGAFKLKDILDALEISYQLTDDNRVVGAIPAGLSCQLEYQSVVLEGKTQVRLQNVYAASKPIEQVI